MREAECGRLAYRCETRCLQLGSSAASVLEPECSVPLTARALPLFRLRTVLTVRVRGGRFRGAWPCPDLPPALLTRGVGGAGPAPWFGVGAACPTSLASPGSPSCPHGLWTGSEFDLLETQLPPSHVEMVTCVTSGYVAKAPRPPVGLSVTWGPDQQPGQLSHSLVRPGFESKWWE